MAERTFDQERAEAIRGRIRIAYAAMAAIWGLNAVVSDVALYGSRVAALWIRIPEAFLCGGMWLWLARPRSLRGIEVWTFVTWTALMFLNVVAMFLVPEGAVYPYAGSITWGTMVIVLVTQVPWRVALAILVVVEIGVQPPQIVRLGAVSPEIVISVVIIALVVMTARSRDRLLRREYDARTGLHAAHARLREVEETRTRLFQNLSHDFRTPLALIRGEAEWVGARAASPGDAAALGRIAANAGALAELTEQLLELARLDAERAPCRRAACDVAAVARQTAALHQPPSGEVRVEVAGDEKPPVAEVDPAQLRRILANLLANAVRAAKGRAGRVDVHVRRHAEDVVVEVADDGEGIPADRRGRIFERFVSFDSDGSTAAGIGLPLARELAELNGGELTLRDGAPRTTFRLRLPAAPRAAAEPAEPALPGAAPSAPDAPQSPPDRSRPEILVVEDNAEMRALLTRLLAERWSVSTAATVADAILALRARRPRAVLCDVLLPDGEGYTVLDQVRGHRGLDGTPFVFVSALGDPAQRARGLAAGADDYVTKPFATTDLCARVAAAVARAESRERALAAQREDFLAELHDGVTASLARAAMLLQRPGGARLEEATAAIREGLEEARGVMALLDAGATPWDHALADLRRDLADAAEAAGIALELGDATDGSCARLSAGERHALRRIVREALTNVLKHAGARRVSCRLEVRDGAVRAIVDDDGRGFGGGPAGRGKGIIARRAARLGGAASFGVSPLGGARVEASFPLTHGSALEPAA